MLPFALLSVAALVSAQTSQVPSTTIDLNRFPPQPQETICGDIVNDNLQNGTVLFFASDVTECLTSVPFNPAVALRFLRYVNQTFQFQANTAYVRSPLAGWQQPSFDFFGDLQAIEDNVNANRYHNQYAFEIDVQVMLQRLHDGHVTIYGGISSQMTFLTDVNLVSVSTDGKQLPEVYIYEDLIQSQNDGGYTASPISMINGQPVVDYLKTFAAKQSFGLVEPNADWNNLMYSPANVVFGLSAFSDSAPFYPGDQLNFDFKNGSQGSTQWFALYESPGYTGPLETGGDFYNLFVLGLLPANFDEQADIYAQQHPDDGSDFDGDQSSNETSWNSLSSGYPADTLMHQADLGEFDNDVALTGYFLPNTSTAVLSIPSFAQFGDSISTYGDALADFLNNATDKNADNIIIDLQQNDGGLVALAFSTFNAFFTNQRPFAGSRMREHQLADILGNTLTTKYDMVLRNTSDDTIGDYIGSEWVVTDRINAQTGRNFSSWPEYQGPIASNGDDFTLIQRYDLSNPTFIGPAFGVDFSDCFYTATCDATTQWKADQIVILTDGLCGSTCSLFVEMMKQVGVRSVVMGGIPQEGPMQAASGTRGAVQYTGDFLADDFAQATSVDDNAAAALSGVTEDTGMSLFTTAFSLRDQIRQNATVPNQALYLPADCRLFWTLANFNNYDQLWTDVHTAMFKDPSLCVPGSTNVTTAPARPASTAPDMVGSDDQGQSLAYYIAHPNGSPSIDVGDREPATDGRGRGPSVQFCTPGETTSGGGLTNTFPCRRVTLPCSCRNGACSSTKSFHLRTKNCQNGNDDACNGALICNTKGNIQNSQQNSRGFRGSIGTQGFCEPNWGVSQQQTNCDDISQTSLNGLLQNDPDSDRARRVPQ